MHSFIGGGFGNCIFPAVAACSSIVGGCNNTIYNPFSFIGAGSFNQNCGSYSFIGGGGGACGLTCFGNCIMADYSFIGTGQSNCTGATQTFIGSGFCNTISPSAASLSSITSGCFNTICAGYSFIGGGIYNGANGRFSFIGNGGGVSGAVTYGNCTSASFAFVGNGQCNYATAQYSFIGNGYGNKISNSCAIACADFSLILGGCNNNICCNYSFIGGGCSNIASGFNSVIVGGIGNCANSNSFAGGGESNKVYGIYSSIVGGNSNYTFGCCTFIGGGYLNKICTGSFSAILGGCGNTVNHNYAAVFGCGITTVSNNTFHVNSLYMKPGSYSCNAGTAGPLTFPIGTVYADSLAGYTLKVQQ